MSQLIASLHVYLSNTEVFRRTSDIMKAGFLAVPNEKILPLLESIGPAFFGGLFFTFTIGAFLSLAAFGCFWMYENIFYRKPLVLWCLLGIWIFLIGCFNLSGFNPFATAYAVFIPLVVFLMSFKTMETSRRKKHWRGVLRHLSVVVLLVGVWAFQIDKNIFIDFRDNLLLSNGIGRAVNDFYYDYTLYSAETFKPLEKKLLKTVRCTGIIENSLDKRLKKTLMTYDYLPLEKEVAADLVVEQKGDQLLFYNRNRFVLAADVPAFFKTPKKYLNNASRILDHNVFFRRFTLASLLAGLPIFLYFLVFNISQFIASRIFEDTKSEKIAAVLCLVIGLSLLLPFHLIRPERYSDRDAHHLLASGNWRQRVAGLKRVYHDKMEIADYSIYKNHLESPHIPERYWLAMALSTSRNPSSYEDLQKMMDDPQPNVACKVLYALGRRGDRSMIPAIMVKLKTSRHWYVQTYAYGALKDLGWKQGKSG